MAAEKFTRQCGLCKQVLPAKVSASSKCLYVYVTCPQCVLMTVTEVVDAREESE